MEAFLSNLLQGPNWSGVLLGSDQVSVKPAGANDPSILFADLFNGGQSTAAEIGPEDGNPIKPSSKASPRRGIVKQDGPTEPDADPPVIAVSVAVDPMANSARPIPAAHLFDVPFWNSETANGVPEWPVAQGTAQQSAQGASCTQVAHCSESGTEQGTTWGKSDSTEQSTGQPAAGFMSLEGTDEESAESDAIGQETTSEGANPVQHRDRSQPKHRLALPAPAASDFEWRTNVSSVATTLVVATSDSQTSHSPNPVPPIDDRGSDPVFRASAFAPHIVPGEVTDRGTEAQQAQESRSVRHEPSSHTQADSAGPSITQPLALIPATASTDAPLASIPLNVRMTALPAQVAQTQSNYRSSSQTVFGLVVGNPSTAVNVAGKIDEEPEVSFSPPAATLLPGEEFIHGSSNGPSGRSHVLPIDPVPFETDKEPGRTHQHPEAGIAYSVASSDPIASPILTPRPGLPDEQTGASQSVWVRLDSGTELVEQPGELQPPAPSVSQIELTPLARDRVSVRVVEGSGGRVEVQVSTGDHETKIRLLGGLDELANRASELSLGSIVEGRGTPHSAKEFTGGNRHPIPPETGEPRRRSRKGEASFALPTPNISGLAPNQ